MKKTIASICLLLLAISSVAQFSIHSNHRYLLKNGKPFFWLGDTAWELFHRLSFDDANRYFKQRHEQGFTVVQAVVLAELDGLHVPNACGHTPLINDDPTKPNEAYFRHVDSLIDLAAAYDINIALLPTWGDKVFVDSWGWGPEIFNLQNAPVYAEWLAKRYKDKSNIIWILGGDRRPHNETDIAIWRSMGRAIMKATDNKAVISFHPQPSALGSAEWFHQDEWLSFNMFQTGHCRDAASYDNIQNDYALSPVKPVLDGEPIYEDHPVCFNSKDLGTSNAYDVRRAAYLDLFAGAFGHTYGCHDVWQMYSPKAEGINGPHLFWYDALSLPGASQMAYVKKLMTAFPITERVPDQSVIKENNYTPAERIQATRGNDYLFVYSSAGRPFTLVPNKISGEKLKAFWFSPRDGHSTSVFEIDHHFENKCVPPSAGYGQDWVLVAFDERKAYSL